MKENSKMSQLFAKVRGLFADMASVMTDKGELYFDGELTVETEVFLKTGEDYVPAPSGEYYADGTKYVVADGVVMEVEKEEDKIPEPAIQPEVTDMGCVKKDEEEVIPQEEIPGAVEAVPADVPNEGGVTRAEFEELAKRVAALEALAKPAEVGMDENSRYSRVMRFVSNL